MHSPDVFAGDEGERGGGRRGQPDGPAEGGGDRLGVPAGDRLFTRPVK